MGTFDKWKGKVVNGNSESQKIFKKLVSLYEGFAAACDRHREAQLAGDVAAIESESGKCNGLWASIQHTKGPELQTAINLELQQELAGLPDEIAKSERLLIDMEADVLQELEAKLPAILEMVFSVGGRLSESGTLSFPENLKPLLLPARDKATKSELSVLKQRLPQRRQRLSWRDPAEVAIRAATLDNEAMRAAPGMDVTKYLLPFLQNR